MGSTSKILIAALAGMVAGGAAGLLLAPEKGSKLRKRITKKGIGIKDELMEKIEEGLSSLQEMKKSLLSSAHETAIHEKDKAVKIKHA